ncbi:ATP12 family chaperone protein [Phenylobacterium sp.]|uniref:ATP12 family chaperone protein n=1 Tax=Phenylobacterium sp. TaxID=1871053 RepID=UPI002F40A82D
MQRGFKEPGDKPRRFYKAVSVAPEPGGFLVKLDERAVRTPGGARLVLPTEALARLIADEWAAQGERLEMAAMHATRLANTAIDAIPAAREPTAADVAQFAASDLLCYRAEAPAALTERQAERWDPILARAEREAGLSFVRARGIVHQAQPARTPARVRALALELDDFRLAGLAFGAALYGSAVLAIAALRAWLSAEEAFDLSRLDEAWQEDMWGEDAEAAQRTARLRGEARTLERWFRSLG